VNKNKILLNVYGIKPAPWGGKEWDWRKAIANEARKYSPTLPASHSGFEVSMIFCLLQTTYDRSDLDNLAKPVLDTIFLPNNPQVKDRKLTGALIRLDGSVVNKLTVEKRLATNASDEGAEIIVMWED